MQYHVLKVHLSVYCPIRLFGILKVIFHLINSNLFTALFKKSNDQLVLIAIYFFGKSDKKFVFWELKTVIISHVGIQIFVYYTVKIMSLI